MKSTLKEAAPRAASEIETKDAPKRILDAAAELFAKQGYSKTTMSEIADKACVSKGLPYVYFPSKHELLDAVQLRAINNWYAETEKHLQIGEEPPIESLKKGFKYSILYSARDPICRAIMAQDPKLLLPNSEKLRAEIVRMNDAGFTLLFEELRKRRIIRTDIPLTDILTIWRITHDSLIHIHTDTFSWGSKNRALEDLIDSALEVLLSGLLGKKG